MAKKKKTNRAALRAERKALRAQRKKKFNALVDALGKTPAVPAGAPEWAAKDFKKYWPALKALLELLEILKATGPKLDKALKEIIALGDKLAKGNSAVKTQFQQKLDPYWTAVRIVLNVIQVWTSKRVDRVLEQVVEIGDWIVGYREK